MQGNSRIPQWAGIAIALLPVCAVAAPIDFHGYFRSGTGSSSDGGDQVCFQLPGAPKKYRLGNECETYGELSLSAEAFKAPNGTTFKLSTMLAFSVQNQVDWEQFSPSWREVFVEADKVGSGAFATASIWAGKRYYDRHDVHINDFYFWSNSGPGAGIQNIDLGFGKFSYALRRNGEGTGNVTAGQRQLVGHDFRLKDVVTNPGGSLTFGLDLRHANSKDGVSNSGATGVTIMHTQNEILGGGFNKLAIQYGKGALSNLDHSFPSFGAKRDDKAWRVVEALVWQPTANSNLSGMATAVYEKRTIAGTYANGDQRSGKWLSFGVRPVYHVNDLWSIAAEFGHDSFTPDGGAKRSLNKFTLAPQFGSGRNFWSRPVIRAFYTYAKWNQAARLAATGDDLGTAIATFGAKNEGKTYGVQAEIWW